MSVKNSLENKRLRKARKIVTDVVYPNYYDKAPKEATTGITMAKYLRTLFYGRVLRTLGLVKVVTDVNTTTD